MSTYGQIIVKGLLNILESLKERSASIEIGDRFMHIFMTYDFLHIQSVKLQTFF
jgi:hypothetical protein